MQLFRHGELITLPMLPMRNIVVFPHVTTPFFIGRRQSIEALERALATDRQIFVIAQKDPMVENPDEDDLYEVGTIGSILQIMRLPNGTIKALFEAKARGRRHRVDLDAVSYEAEVEVITSRDFLDEEAVALIRSVKDEFKRFVKKLSKPSDNLEKITTSDASPGELADLIAPLLTLDI